MKYSSHKKNWRLEKEPTFSGSYIYQIPINKPQIPNNLQSSNSNNQKTLFFLNFGDWDFGHFLIIGLPARSPALRDEGRYLGFGA